MTYMKNVTTLEYNRDLCSGCGFCTTVCPHEVFKMDNRKAAIVAKDNCMECGACMMNCPTGAIAVDKGVGCAYAVIVSKLRGSEEISCDCGGGECEEESSSGGCCC